MKWMASRSSVFPASRFFRPLGDDTMLKPTLDWTLFSQQAERFDAEPSYLSGGGSETKQVEFLRASGIRSTRLSAYDGARFPLKRKL